MCKRLKELRLPVSMVLANRQIFDGQKRHELELTTDDWSHLETLCDLLEPFALLTKFFEGQSYISISAVQPFIKGTIIAMNVLPGDPVFVVQFKQEACKQLETRFDYLFSIQPPSRENRGFVPVAVKACAVDPRFHKLKSLNAGQPRTVRTCLEDEMNRTIAETNNLPATQPTHNDNFEGVNISVLVLFSLPWVV